MWVLASQGFFPNCFFGVQIGTSELCIFILSWGTLFGALLCGTFFFPLDYSCLSLLPCKIFQTVESLNATYQSHWIVFLDLGLRGKINTEITFSVTVKTMLISFSWKSSWLLISNWRLFLKNIAQHALGQSIEGFCDQQYLKKDWP